MNDPLDVPAPAVSPSVPVTRYFGYTPRAIKTLLVILLALLVAQGGVAHWHGPEKVAACLLGAQMLLLGVFIAPSLPIWQRRPGVPLDETPEPPPDTPTFRDGF